MPREVPTIRETSRSIHKFKHTLGAELSLRTEPISNVSAVSPVSAASQLFLQRDIKTKIQDKKFASPGNTIRTCTHQRSIAGRAATRLSYQTFSPTSKSLSRERLRGLSPMRKPLSEHSMTLRVRHSIRSLVSCFAPNQSRPRK